jgi:glutathionylspermidine synthase
VPSRTSSRTSFTAPSRSRPPLPLIEASWHAETPSIYGRFDLTYDGTRPPRLLEYNADTPTSLLEAAVVQWYWLEDSAPASDQFDSSHERLIELWKHLASAIPGGRIDFTSIDNLEEGITVTYLADTARQAGPVCKRDARTMGPPLPLGRTWCRIA